MRSAWNTRAAARCGSELALRAYSSRLIGADANLALYGGGNTSVKIGGTLWVKGSGSDLARVNEQNFTPLKLAATRRVLAQNHLDSAAAERAILRLVDKPSVPKPSIETPLHAALPFKFVEHCHADSVLAVVNCRNGGAIAADVFGDLAPLVPYRDSGIDLARACVAALADCGGSASIGLILHHHGMCAFGAEARESYENLVLLVDRAERYLKRRRAWSLPRARRVIDAPAEIARLRRLVSTQAGRPLIGMIATDSVACAYSNRGDLASLAKTGPATPQHAIFTKRVAAISPQLPGYAAAYRRYLARHRPADWSGVIPDCAPRVVVWPGRGLLAFGVDAASAAMTLTVYRHALEIQSRAAAHDQYTSLPPAEVLAAELHYGGFETGLVQGGGPLLGRIALLAGLSSLAAARWQRFLGGLGACCVVVGGEARLAAANTLVLGRRSAPQRGLVRATARFGGIDIVVDGSRDHRWLDASSAVLRHSPHPPCAVVAEASAQRSLRFSSLAVERKRLEECDASTRQQIKAFLTKTG